MDDARGMRFGEAVGDLEGEIEKPSGGQGSFVEELPQGASLDELHGDVEHGIGRSDVVDRDDVGVVKRRGRARFLLETFSAIGVAGDTLRQDFHGDVPPKPGVARAIDLAHASRADRRKNLVGTEPRTGG